MGLPAARHTAVGVYPLGAHCCPLGTSASRPTGDVSWQARSSAGSDSFPPGKPVDAELDESSSDESAPSPVTGSSCLPCTANEGPWEKTESLDSESPDLFPCSKEAATQEGPELDESTANMPIIHSWDLARTYSNLRLQRQGGLTRCGVGLFHPSSLSVNTGEPERSESPSDEPVVEAAAQTDSEIRSFNNVRVLHQRAVSSSGLDCLGDDTQHRTQELDSTSLWTSAEIHSCNIARSNNNLRLPRSVCGAPASQQLASIPAHEYPVTTMYGGDNYDG